MSAKLDDSSENLIGVFEHHVLVPVAQGDHGVRSCLEILEKI